MTERTRKSKENLTRQRYTLAADFQHKNNFAYSGPVSLSNSGPVSVKEVFAATLSLSRGYLFSSWLGNPTLPTVEKWKLTRNYSLPRNSLLFYIFLLFVCWLVYIPLLPRRFFPPSLIYWRFSTSKNKQLRSVARHHSETADRPSIYGR